MELKTSLASIGDYDDPFRLTKKDAIDKAVKDVNNTCKSKKECFDLTYNKYKNNVIYEKIYEQIYIPVYIEIYKKTLYDKGIEDAIFYTNLYWKKGELKTNPILEIMGRMKYGSYYIDSYLEHYRHSLKTYGDYPKFAIPKSDIKITDDKKIVTTEDNGVFMIQTTSKKGKVDEGIVSSNGTSTLCSTANPKIFELKSKK